MRKDTCGWRARVLCFGAWLDLLVPGCWARGEGVLIRALSFCS